MESKEEKIVVYTETLSPYFVFVRYFCIREVLLYS